MARIYRRTGKKGGIWYLDYQVEGRRVRKRVGSSKRLAELARADIEVKIERKEAGFAVKDRNLRDFIAEYLGYAKGNKTENSLARDAITLRHFSDFIKADKLSGVSAARIEAYKARRRELGAKPSTLNRELNTIKAMFNKAVAWGALAANPAKSVQKVREPRKQVRFLAKDEVRALLSAASERLAPILETFLLTGLRRDELAHLTWADIDFEREVVSVQAKDGWHPKDYEVRHIPMTERLVAVLKARPRTESPYVFHTQSGGAHEGNILSRDFRRLARSCGIKGASVHTLRHTFASHLVMGGADLYTVQKLLGHSSIKTTEIYAHLAPDYLRSAVRRLKY
ncbi:MAG: tyrosine-type recombinase/integrase [Elusimicrobia bacterium]|nr:tyrosine-type recombinase/integrase [Elusimicrobiota bacterium]